MEKNFTLMKTLTAFRDLLFPRSRKNCRTVNNNQTSTAGCGTGKVNNLLICVNDAKQPDASFLFFNKSTIDDQESKLDSPQSKDNEQKLNGKEDSDSYRGKKVND